MANAQRDVGVLLSRAIYNPTFRLIWSAGSAALLAVFLVGDWMARSGGGYSFQARSAADLWFAVALGAAVGVVGAVWERFLLVRRRTDQLAFHRAPLEGRLKWKYQRVNLRQNGWGFLLLYGLMGWCAWSMVFVGPPILAVNAVAFAFNLRLVGAFRVELGCQPGAEHHAAPNPAV